MALVQNIEVEASGVTLLGDGAVFSKSAVGTYKLTFTQALPSAYACVTANITKQNAGDNIEIASISTTEANLVVRDSSGVLHDSDYASVLAYM